MNWTDLYERAEPYDVTVAAIREELSKHRADGESDG